MRKNRTLRLLGGAMAAVMATGSLAACGSTATPTAGGTSASTTAATAAQSSAASETAAAEVQGALPLSKEKITLQFLGMNMNTTRPGRWDETDMMKKLEEETNIHIVWDMVPQASWTEKKNLLIASRELPDAFCSPFSLSAEEAQKMGADGVLIPLDDLIAEHAPTLTELMKVNPDYDTVTRSLDGKIYALSQMQDLGFTSQSAAIIRQDWLDKLGLKMPTTTEEFYNVLKAFKTQDPNGNGQADEIPFSFLFQEGASVNREVKREFDWIWGAFGVAENPKHIAITDAGEVYFTASTEGFRNAVSYMNRLYSEGLVDPEVFTQDRALLMNKIRQDPKVVGVYSDYRLRLSMAQPEDEANYAFMPPLEGPDGSRMFNRAFSGVAEGAFAITEACKYPVEAIRWVDYINQPENNIQMAYGMFKEAGWNASEAMVPDEKEPQKYSVNSGMRPKDVDPANWPFSSPIAVSPVLTTREIIDTYMAVKDSNVAKEETCAVYEPYLTKYPHNYPYRFTVEEIEDLSLIQTDLIGYILKTEAKWIVEGGIEEDWDEYLAQLEKLSVGEYLDMYRTSFERAEKE